MQPAKMLAAQDDLVHRLMHQPRYIDFVLQMIAQNLGAPNPRLLNEAKSRTAVTLASLMYQSAKEARCFHVSKDMTALIQYAAASLDDTDVVDFKELAPANYGLVLFEGGLEVLDPRGEVMLMDWILWGDCGFVVDDGSDERQVPRGSDRITHDGFAVWEFNDRLDNPDGISLQIERSLPKKRLDEVMGRWNILGNHVVQSGNRLGPALVETDGLQRQQIIEDGLTPIPATNTLRLIHAFWLLLNQPISETSLERLTAPAKKAAKAAGMKKTQADNDVSVVQLRRSARQAREQAAVAPQRHVEWAGRWYVNGFWRWQAYGPGRKERKRIWVDGFVKGPADKPIIHRKHVYAVRP